MKKQRFFSESEEERKMQEVHQKLMMVLDILEKHYKQRPNKYELAKMVDMNADELERKFAERHGLTPAEFIDAYRAQDSEAVLVRSSMRVEKIAQRFGFSSTEAYRKAFEKEFDSTPEDYRERYRYDSEWKSYLQSCKERRMKNRS